MHVTKSIQQVRARRWADPAATWGFVPTMGYLHEGHLSLVQASTAANQWTAASIYVNPTQFAPGEDLSTYPRNLARDLALLEAAGVDLVFTPSDGIMYPAGYQTNVRVDQVTQPLEGASRPEHFKGVATIVTKLLNIVQPTHAYFGQKDFQQTVVIKRLVADLNLNTTVVICPIVREADGLALSSRNLYLSPAERSAATVLSRTIAHVEQLLDEGVQDGGALRDVMGEMIAAESLAHIDYVSVADPDTLLELESIGDSVLASLAVFFGKTRLIDNVYWKKR